MRYSVAVGTEQTEKNFPTAWKILTEASIADFDVARMPKKARNTAVTNYSDRTGVALRLFEILTGWRDYNSGQTSWTINDALQSARTRRRGPVNNAAAAAAAVDDGTDGHLVVTWPVPIRCDNTPFGH